MMVAKIREDGARMSREYFRVTGGTVTLKL